MVETGWPHSRKASPRSESSASLHASSLRARLRSIAERLQFPKRKRRRNRVTRAECLAQRVVIAHEHAEVARIGARIDADQPAEALPLIRVGEPDRFDAVGKQHDADL